MPIAHTVWLEFAVPLETLYHKVMNMSNPNDMLLLMASNKTDSADVKMMLHALQKVFRKTKWKVAKVNNAHHDNHRLHG